MAEADSLGDQFLGLPTLDFAAYLLQLGGDVAGQHLEVPSAKHAGSAPEIAYIIWGDGLKVFGCRSFRRKGVLAIEVGEIKALGQDEDVGHKVAHLSQ